jgi:serine/threonine protein kinase
VDSRVIGEELELAIYRFVEERGKGQGRSTDIVELTGLVPGADRIDVVDALIRLHDADLIRLRKYTGQPDDPKPYGLYIADRLGREKFFYSGDINITLTPKGRLDMERRIAALAAATAFERPSALPPSERQTRIKRPQIFETALNTYTYRGPLGEGANGWVYDVTDDDQQHFALKHLRAGLSREKRRRFKNELSFCARGLHQNIIEVLDWGFVATDPENSPFFVMHRFPATLRELMKAGIHHDQVLGWFDKILDGIAAAHASNVWHRDLKPENILCDPAHGTLAIADFGIAHFAEDLLHAIVETGPSDKLANFQYAAPEQRRRGGMVDHRADIYSLGLILNEMFTGELRLGTAPKLIATAAPKYRHLDELVDRMLRQTPDDRPSVMEVRAALAENEVAVATAALAEPSRPLPASGRHGRCPATCG